MSPRTTPPRGALRTPEAADYLGVPEGSLPQWRKKGFGPKYLKVGGGNTVVYRIKDLDAYLDELAVEQHGVA
jgi:hypothetical protein